MASFSFGPTCRRVRDFLPCPPCHRLPPPLLLYLGWLQEEDKVHASSFQPYLSAINQAHVNFGFPPPAVCQLVRLARRGFGEVEGETSAAVRCVPLPASVALRILRLGLDTPSVPTIRIGVCLVVQFLWFARADTSIHLRDGITWG
jgi:hypothetical protein